MVSARTGVRQRGWIVASRVERVAFGQAFHREPAATERAVEAQALRCVTRAGRVEAAHWAEQRGKRDLVHADEKDQEARNHRLGSRASLRLRRTRRKPRELLEASTEAWGRSPPLRNDAREPEVSEWLSHDHDHVDARRPELARRAIGLPHQALGPIARHRVADATRRRDAEPRRCGRALQREHEHEMARLDALPRRLNALKLGAFAHASGVTHGGRRCPAG
jgi:hypothetical protein